MFDGKAFGEEVVGFVRDYLEREVAPLKAENEDLKARLKALEDRPAPEKGEKGDPGEPGKDGANGADGKDGADGAGVVDILQDHEGNLVFSMTDGRMKTLGKVRGEDGKDGKDGRDGFQLEDFDAQVLDDDRTIEFKFVSGDYERIATLKWPTIIDRGVFKQGETYQPGDAVTWGGSLWIAQRETEAKPDTADSGFRLAVKRGRDGKDAKNG